MRQRFTPDLRQTLMSLLRFPIALGAAVMIAACATPRAADTGFVMGQVGATARARADSLKYPYTKADIDFMSGMIHHHAQAILISRWAPTHEASAAVQRLTARIINAQSDEITLMQFWLKDRNQPAMQVDTLGNVSMDHSAHNGHSMADMSAMPGMLSDSQLRELNAARGAEFDRLFLSYMIQHHRGAVSMVKTLFSAQGAGQDETVFKFAADVEVDQSTEIKRMLSMLFEMGVAFPPA
jgi:uncharacterized protein (DUF305 family)